MKSCYNCPALRGKINSPGCWLFNEVVKVKGKFYSSNCKKRPLTRKEFYDMQGEIKYNK